MVALYAAYRQAEEDGRSAAELLEDPEMRELAQAEVASVREAIARLELELQKALLPRDPDDDRNLFLEIRAGTGGEEAALFAGDLLRMYSRYAERQGWRVEVVSTAGIGAGWLQGSDPARDRLRRFARLKFESGGHRATGSRHRNPGRIHTGVCTVAGCPKPTSLPVEHQYSRPAHRHLPRQRGRWPAYQQDGLRGADHPPADGHRCGVPGRPLATSEQGPGAVGPRRADQDAAARAAGQNGGNAKEPGWQWRPLRENQNLQSPQGRVTITASTSRSTSSMR